MRIFVAGTGFTGQRILNTLQRDGHEVFGLSRHSPEGLLKGVRHVTGDVLAEDGLHSLAQLPPMDLLVSTLSGTGLKDAEAYRRLYVDGPRRVADGLTWHNRPRIWMLGSTGVYGESDGEWVDESTEPSPAHRNGEVQLEAETALRSAADETCVLRLSGLYGPGRTRLVRQAMRKRPCFKPDIWSNQIHGDDVAGVLSFLVGLESPPPETLLVSDDLPVQRKEVFDWIRQTTGLSEGCLDEDHPYARGRNRGNKRVSNARLRALGASLNYPTYREGLLPLLDDAVAAL